MLSEMVSETDFVIGGVGKRGEHGDAGEFMPLSVSQVGVDLPALITTTEAVFKHP